MRPKRIEHIKAGEPITAAFLNSIAERLERFVNLRSGSPYVRILDSPYGKSIALAFPQPTYARLSGSTSPYSFVEVRDAPGGTWVDMPEGDSGTDCVYEVNNKSGLDGKIVEVHWTAARDWRFQWVGYGPCQVAEICVIVTGGCDGKPVAADVTVTQDETLIGTCVTVGEVGSLSLSSQGSGYTNGTGYSLGFSGGGGSGATGTFDVVAGKITNPVLTNGGTGYTGVPTITFPGAGSGTGGSVIAGMQARCCVSLPDVGTYDLEVASDGFNTVTQEVVATCATSTQTIALVKTVGTCCSGCPTVPTSDPFVLTDANGTIPMTWYGSPYNAWYGGYSFSAESVVFQGPDTGCECGCCDLSYGTGSVGVVYSLQCLSGVWTLFMGWMGYTCNPSTVPPCSDPPWRGYAQSGVVPPSGGTPPTLEFDASGDAACCPNVQNLQRTPASIDCNPLSMEFDFPTATVIGLPVPSPGTVVVTL